MEKKLQKIREHSTLQTTLLQTVGGREYSALQTTLLTVHCTLQTILYTIIQTIGEREHSDLTDNTAHCYTNCKNLD